MRSKRSPRQLRHAATAIAPAVPNLRSPGAATFATTDRLDALHRPLAAAAVGVGPKAATHDRRPHGLGATEYPTRAPQRPAQPPSQHGHESIVLAAVRPRIPCRFAPQCPKTFCNKSGMTRHCTSAHVESKTRSFKCEECEELRLFATKKLLGAHIRNSHREHFCICGSKISAGSMSRHRKTCRKVAEDDRIRSAVELVPSESTDVPLKDPLGPAMSSKARLPPTLGLTRSAHHAPPHKLAIETLPHFWSFLRGDTVLFRSGVSSARAMDKMSKFRTFVGKFAQFHKVETTMMLTNLADKNACAHRFEIKKLCEFCATLDTSDKGERLAASTIYNVVSALGEFLTWQTSTNRVRRLLEAKNAIADLTKRLSPKRKRDNDPDAHAKRIAKLPKVPEVLTFLHTVLQNRVQSTDPSSDSAWNMYKNYFNFILVMMLFGIPPQRASIYRRLKVKHISTKDGILLIKISKHKTSNIYGPLVIAIPADYRKEFERFLEARSRLVRETGSSDGSLFLREDGCRDKQLTRSFSVLIHCGFKKRVSIRDCRRIFITHAYDTKEFRQEDMVKLARQMYHSFEMQQRTYVSKTSVDTAITSLDSVQCLNPFLADSAPSIHKQVKHSRVGHSNGVATQLSQYMMDYISSSDDEGSDSSSDDE